MSSIAKLCLICALAAALGLITIPTRADQGPTLTNLAMQQNDLSLFVKAAQLGGVVGRLEGCGPFTIFAPVDCAWANLCTPTAEELLTPCNKATLASIVMYHAVCGSYSLSDFDKSKCCPLILKTLSGGTLTILEKDGCWYVNGARILGEGIPTSNGTLFKIDRVLIPPGVRVQQKG